MIIKGIGVESYPNTLLQYFTRHTSGMTRQKLYNHPHWNHHHLW